MPDVRLIDANALEIYKFETSDAFRGFVTVIPFDLIATAPTIDAVPVVHARWVHEQRYGDSGSWVWRCSACRKEAVSPIISALKYCHICGAKMDAKE